ncbi:hypothetical protein DPMN_177607 [Dreissena polymorpha]|uniref:Uncharacterized protein n=1 Tax=Dreissena polymorpha TaxID=45954 RepID=A0A9D4EDC0_DREPO|nr:hypothetical protein DPMN_177607 [Dreissena polymorpha]
MASDIETEHGEGKQVSGRKYDRLKEDVKNDRVYMNLHVESLNVHGVALNNGCKN